MLDAIVVGAGAAGIAAARRLQEAGLRFSVLEARARGGGRAVTSTHWRDAPADLGAAWLHFADENAWTSLARSQGLTVIEREPDWGAASRVGARLPAPAEAAAFGAALERNFGLVDAAAASGRDVPVASVVPDDAFRPRFDAIITWAVGVDSRDASTLDVARYAESAHDWAVREGLGCVVAGAAGGLPITCDTPVTAIRWGRGRVRVESGGGTHEARAVIVTVPPAVLAAGAIRFDPPLPEPWASALDALPAGVVNKVFFRLDDADLPFAETTHLVGSDATARTAHYAVRPAGQPLVMAYFGGSFSAELEARGGLAAFAREQLCAAFGARFLDRCRGELATAWGADPWARGSYSAARPGHAQARALLATPVAPELLFAGEACSRRHYGTLHGAWNSGRAAADRVVARVAGGHDL